VLGITRSGVVVAGLVILAAVAPAAAAGASTAGSSSRPQAAAALYYEAETTGGADAIDRLSLVGTPTVTQVVAVGHTNMFGLAVAGGFVYWTTETAPSGRGAIWRAPLAGGPPRRLVAGLSQPASLVAAHGELYWDDETAIGRVALGGGRADRRFLVLPEETGGGVADGLATDGRYLYFSRCEDDTIGRVHLNGTGIDQSLITIANRSCAQGLAVGGGHLYWTELGMGTIGRANLDGTHANLRWLSVRSDQGPFQIATDGVHVYWTWGGVAGSPSYTGRANANGSHLDRRFLTNSLFPMALTGVAPAGSL